jgi:hypothetical protein
VLKNVSNYAVCAIDWDKFDQIHEEIQKEMFYQPIPPDDKLTSPPELTTKEKATYVKC